MPAEAKSAQFKGFMTELCQDDIRLPKYKRSVPVKPEKKEEMYPVKWPPYTHSDVETRIANVLEPLSLFAPYPHEDHKEAPMPEEENTMELERPVTPIDEEIRSQPKSLEQLTNYVRRRIAAKPDVQHLSVYDQRNLAGILVGEISLIWPEIKQQIDDPFLSPEENKELSRRISVHIVTVCEKLFNHYLRKAQVLNERGVFSGPANMSRLKAQLALDANKFLNILTIRRYIVADIQGKDDSDTDDMDAFNAKFRDKPQSAAPPPMSFKSMIQSSRPKSKTKKFRYKTAEQEAKEITMAMPDLDTNKLMGLVADLPDRDLQTPSEGSYGRGSRADDRPSRASGPTDDELITERVLLKRSNSMPKLQYFRGENVFEDVDLGQYRKRDILDVTELKILKSQATAMEKASEMPIQQKGPQPGTREYAENDLKQLVTRPQDKEVGKIEEDLPPLLQALTRSAKHDGMMVKVEKKIKELEEKERAEQERKNIPLRQPTHPQPATVSANLSGMTVRASDIRVSERVCMSSITIDRYTTVYNDLMDEIDPVTVKNLDKNLFLGDEITEVYKEIMKTVPATHLRLDDDSMVVPAAEEVNMSGTMASASLSKKRSDRVINPRLSRDKGPPWGKDDPKEWVRTPNNPPKNFLGEDIFQPTTPNMERVHDAMHNPGKMSRMLKPDNMPKFVAEKMARTYASWLQWWKSTINSDDYMKYLSTTLVLTEATPDRGLSKSNSAISTVNANRLLVPKKQESDYMGVAFHFYDSEDEDDDDELDSTPNVASLSLGQSHLHNQLKVTKPLSSKLAELKEREKKVNELKEEKTKFETGFWNVNTVMMGGLGKDPYLVDDVDDDASSKRQKSASTSRSAKTLHERAAARHSAKLQEKASARDLAHSRQSKVTSVTGTMSKMDTERSEEESAGMTAQERMEKVWKSLEMPDALKLDMAIKYSCNEFYSKLTEAIDRWEKVTELVLKREELLGKLEKFERNASDPNRFFEKGNKGSSVKRLQEAKQRSYFYKRIEYYEREIKAELDYMKENFQDTVTFRGRSYDEKMKWDRIEMLYWLQEERKQNAIKYESMMKHVPVKVNKAQLDPIPMSVPERVQVV